MKAIIDLVENIFGKIIEGSLTIDDIPTGLRIRVALDDKKIHCKFNYPFSFDFTPKCSELVSFIHNRLANDKGFIDIEKHIVSNKLSILHIFTDSDSATTATRIT